MYFEKFGSGKPIVFLHGWGCDGTIFLPVVKFLPDFKCYLSDFNGFGNTPAPPCVWGVEEYARATFAFLQIHNLKRVSIVAHSFGCRVALVLAAQHPECVDKMLLVAPAALRMHSFSRWCKVRRYKFRKFLHKLHFVKRLPQNVGSADYQSCAPSMKGTFVKVVNTDLRRYAKRVDCPVVIVNGCGDAETPLKHAKRLQKLIKHSALTEIQGGHFAFFQNPLAFSQTVRYLFGDKK